MDRCGSTLIHAGPSKLLIVVLAAIVFDGARLQNEAFAFPDPPKAKNSQKEEKAEAATAVAKDIAETIAASLKKALQAVEARPRKRREADRMRELMELRRLEVQMRFAKMKMKIAAARIRIVRPAPSQPSSNGYTDEAALKTDAELDRLLKRADEFAAGGRIDLAVVLWQKVLDESNDSVMTRDEWIDRSLNRRYKKYRPVSTEVERSLARLPAAGLRIYRLRADGDAKAVLSAGAGVRKEQALREVVRRFFLSSLGDDAAFELACLKLERGDYVGASRLLNKLLHEHPDSNISADQILVRLAAANGRLGDQETARAVLTKLEKTVTSTASQRAFSLVERDVEQSRRQAVARATSANGWHMAFGTPGRNGYMQSLATELKNEPHTQLWTHPLDIPLASLTKKTMQLGGNSAWAVDFGRKIRVVRDEVLFVEDLAGGRFVGGFASGGFGVSTRVVQTTVSPEFMINRWKSGGWQPAGQLLLDDDRVYFKGKDRLVCANATTGDTLWLGRRNQFPLDPLSQFYVNMRNSGVSVNLLGERPISQSEVVLFGDRIAQSMSIAGNLILSLEGTRLDSTNATTQKTTSRFRFGRSTPRRTRQNWLAAYDAITGDPKWHRSANDDPSGTRSGIGFLAAPVPFAKLLLAPVSDNGELWIYALASTDGKTAWKTRLCDEPSGGCSQWSPVGIAVDGGDAYVASGAGAIFALDAASGDLRWAVGYQRSGTPDTQLARFGYQIGGRLKLNGFRDDIVIPHGRQLIVMASDYDHVFALDRRTGALLWDSPKSPSQSDAPTEYCLGLVGDSLYVAGKNVVRKYDAGGGRILWETPIGDSLGRAALTRNAIYVPVLDSVVRLDLELGKERGRAQVVTPSREPVGNLYSDGTRLLVVGMGRVYTLTELQGHLDRLAESIAAGSGRAQFKRMRLRIRLGKKDEALADLRSGYELLLKSEEAAISNEALYDGITELELASSQPILAIELLTAAETAVKNGAPIPDSVQNTLVSKRSTILYKALKAVHDKKLKRAVPAILNVAAICTNQQLQTVARRAIAVTVDKSHADQLRALMKSDDANVRAVSAAGLEVALREQPANELKEMLAADDDSTRLVAAVVLANRGDRAALPALGDLLTSADQPVRGRSVHVLRALTGKHFNYSASESVFVRDKATTDWQVWLGSEGATAKLSFPINEANLLLGRTLICNYRLSRVIEIDSKGQITWQQPFPGAFACHGLPNGHRLVASYTSRTVVEYDATGKQVWKTTVAGRPFSVRRLLNGNTLVACYDNGKLLEIKPDGSIAWEVTLPRQPADARRLENGNTLVCLMSGGRVVEIDRAGKTVWDLTGVVSNPRSAQRLPNGNTLVCDYGHRRVVEVNRSKQIVWRKTGLSSPTDVQRLPNGNTLISHSRGLTEVDAKGKVVSTRNESGTSRFSRF